MASRSLCLPPARTHFCTSATRGGSYGTGSSPRKNGTNCIIPEFVNIGAVGWCGMRPADGTIVWARAAKKSRNFWRSSSDRIATKLPTGRFQLRSNLCFPLAHGLAAVGHGGPEIGTEAAERSGQIGRNPFGRVALHRVAHEPHHPERHAEAEARADHQPEQSLEHGFSRDRGCGGTGGRHGRCPTRTQAS